MIHNKENKTIVYFRGGLGNQLFLYSLVLILESQFDNIFVIIDRTYLSATNSLRQFFDTNFNITSLVFDMRSFEKPRNLKWIYYRFVYKILDMLNLRLPSRLYFENRRIVENVSQRMVGKILIGDWQNQNYLLDNRDFLLAKIHFRCELNETHKYYDYLTDYYAVYVHIRCGQDYINNDWTLSLNYYKASFNKYLELMGSKVFFVCLTDNVRYLKDRFRDLIKNYSVIIDDLQPSEISSFYLLNNAKNLIISNSSFSWWAAYLNKTTISVIYPKPWIIDKSGREITVIIPDQWIEIINHATI